MYYKYEFFFNTMKEGNVLFNDALNTFHLQLYGVGYLVNSHTNTDTCCLHFMGQAF